MILTQNTGFFEDVTLRTVIKPYPAILRKEPKSTHHLSTEETHSPSNNYPTNIRCSPSQDVDFVESVVIIETGLTKTSLTELQQNW
ncbi:unnamed protein product [Hymenolepis diminuta]|uniref:Uncharacterized protein n=1 Tax=Hymenolepis diminuta TaxID=6216 RepID=A0A564YIW6_HYMDI|nr:unnamed protein product [Hymenolepis diminuta]